MTKKQGKLVRLPMRHIDGEWEYEFGGKDLAKQGATGELVVRASSITDRSLVERMLHKTKIKIFEEGTVLRAMLSVDPVSPRRHFMDGGPVLNKQDFGKEFGNHFWGNRFLTNPAFVEVSLGRPTERQLRLDDDNSGGLWLRLEGTRSIGLISSSVIMPEAVSFLPAFSLNHAFTMLSEKYEDWRKSHTGNVYTRFYYQEVDKLWYPLELLRQSQIAKKEQQIAHGLWQGLVWKMRNGQGQSD